MPPGGSRRLAGASRPRGAAGMLLAVALALAAPSLQAHPELIRQIEHLTGQINEAPRDAALYVRRADLHRRHGDTVSARADLDRARRTDPAADGIDYVAARVDLDEGRSADAEQALDRHLARHPGDANALAWRGRAREQQGLHAEAAVDFEAAIARTANPAPDLYRRWVHALAADGEERWPEALRAADAGVQLFGAEPTLSAQAADLALALGRPERVEATLAALPAGVASLASWRVRAALAACLGGAEPTARAAFAALAAGGEARRGVAPTEQERQWAARLADEASETRCADESRQRVASW